MLQKQPCGGNILVRLLIIVFMSQVYSVGASLIVPKKLEEVGNDSKTTTQAVFVMQDGVQLPGITLSSSNKDKSVQNLHLVLLHGLGAKNPKMKDHTTDDWTRLVAHAAFSHISSVTFFASRGHRGTKGWEATAESDIDQFTWIRLSRDMLQVAEVVSSAASKVIMGGSSMGSASALYSALHSPEKVAGLILIRPPTAWEERRARKMHLLSSAKKCQEMNEPEEKYHFVLRGTANSDLPPLGDPSYSSILCPVLILAVENDDTHPLSTATHIQRALRNAELVVSADLEAASLEWPEIIANFIKNVQVS